MERWTGQLGEKNGIRNQISTAVPTFSLGSLRRKSSKHESISPFCFPQPHPGVYLQDAGIDNAWVTLGGTGLGSDGLDGTNNLVGFRVSLGDFAENDVLAVQPAGDDSGDEELGSVAVETLLLCDLLVGRVGNLRVWSGVGHGQEEWAVVLELEVLIGELLAIDGTSTGTVMTGEISSLQPKNVLIVIQRLMVDGTDMKDGITLWKMVPL